MNILYVMVGIPGSGKSTHVKVLKNLYHEAIILSTDDYLEEKAKELGLTYGDVIETHYKEAEKHLRDQLEYAIKKGRPVIWDQTNLRIKKRKKILSSFPDTYQTVAVYVDVPLDVALKRVEKRGELTGKTISKGIVISMYNSREELTEDEGFHVIYTVDGSDPISNS